MQYVNTMSKSTLLHIQSNKNLILHTQKLKNVYKEDGSSFY